jgi:hypothetical protein
MPIDEPNACMGLPILECGGPRSLRGAVPAGAQASGAVVDGATDDTPEGRRDKGADPDLTGQARRSAGPRSRHESRLAVAVLPNC